MNNNFHENRLVGLGLTFIGGMIDYYTYIHYKTFASAQTGNLIIAIQQVQEYQWDLAMKKLLSITFFFLGVLITKLLIDFFKKKGIHHWRLLLIYFESLIFYIFSLQFMQSQEITIIIAISFMSAVRWTSFDKIKGLAYTNLFTTGNIKGLASSIYDYLRNKDSTSRKNFLHFIGVVISFIIGVITSLLLYKLLYTKTVLIISGLFLYIALHETFFVWKFCNEVR